MRLTSASFRRRVAAAIPAAAVLACAPTAPADPADLLELAEAKTALKAAVERADELHRKLAAAEAKSAGLAESLAAANAEADKFRGEYRDLRLQLEALGIDVLREDSRGLDQRLLAAVSDLSVLREENLELTEQLLELSEAIYQYIGSSVATDPEARAELEGKLRRAGSVISASSAESSALDRERRALEEVKVVSVKADLGLVVFNAGDADGIRIGTPLRIHRVDRPVASAVVVDVRSAISGAIITRVSGAEASGAVEVGDSVRLESAAILTN